MWNDKVQQEQPSPPCPSASTNHSIHELERGKAGTAWPGVKVQCLLQGESPDSGSSGIARPRRGQAGQQGSSPTAHHALASQTALLGAHTQNAEPQAKLHCQHEQGAKGGSLQPETAPPTPGACRELRGTELPSLKCHLQSRTEMCRQNPFLHTKRFFSDSCSIYCFAGDTKRKEIDNIGSLLVEKKETPLP